ncbi:MAG TPA: pilus assembly protein PilM [Candidatus Rubrimentiphilum sp.]|nr:pilus assembly protein PilM [Candidatus Rubrimentiphilum sp.]
MSAHSLPLGIDIGSSRIRVAHAVKEKGGPALRAIAVREFSSGAIENGTVVDIDYTAALIEDAVSELRTRERRCVGAIGAPHAFLKPLKLPPMTSYEREKAARFEARRYVDEHFGDAVVRVRPLDPKNRLWTLGIARKNVLQSRAAAIKRAGLRIDAIDDEGHALRRAFPSFNLIVDVGLRQTRVHAAATSQTFHTYAGGSDITAAISSDLRIDEASAEKRKRILGTAGAGEPARLELVREIAALIALFGTISPGQKGVVVGNGARLSGLSQDLKSATGIQCDMIVSPLFGRTSYPRDVIAAAAPDWTLAVSLAMRP